MPKNGNLHMVGLAAICRGYGRHATQSVLKRKKIRSHVEIICLASSYLNYWAGLQKDEDKTSIEMGAEALKEAALLHHPQARPQQRSGRAVSGNGAVMLT
jgi:hypothetical protein